MREYPTADGMIDMHSRHFDDFTAAVITSEEEGRCQLPDVAS